MPKTRNAFAFKDYYRTKILQRSYFKQFNLPEQTDDEILKLLQPAADDDVDTMEKKLSTTKALHERAKEFIILINRHGDRYRKLTRLLLRAGKIEGTVVTPPADYLDAIFGTKDLMDNLAKNYYCLENQIQRTYRKTFCERLKHYRKAARLTQRELGDAVQVSTQGISKYELGQREMPLHTVIRVARVLKISTDQLLGAK